MNTYPSYKDSDVEWIGNIPSGWIVKKLKYIGDLYGGLTGKSGKDFNNDNNPHNKPFIPFTNIVNNNYISDKSLEFVNINPDERQNKVIKNDLLFLMSSEVYDDLGKTSILFENIDELYLNSFCKGFRIFDKKVNPFLINYQLSGNAHRKLISIEGNGFTRINLRQHKLNSIYILIPPLPEQQQISDYLDYKTSKIDTLIEKIKQKIELLKEQRISLINTAVTKGFNPNVEMKDSGVELIGEVPSGWDVKKLKYISKILPSNVDKRISPEEIQVRLCNYTDVYYNESIDKETPLSKGSCNQNEYDKFWLREGDIIITKDSEMPDDIGISTEIKEDLVNVVCGYHLTLIRPLDVVSSYLFRLFQSDKARKYFQINSEGVTRFGLGKPKIQNMYIPLPPIQEQEQIVDYLDKESSKIDTLITKESKQIELLKEYRQSLISNVVTGKVDVRNEVLV